MTVLLLLGAIAGLFVVDSVLAHQEAAAVRSRARHLFDEGRRLRAAGRPDEAASRFREALTLARGDREYLLALGEAELEAGRLSEAEAALGQLLDRDGLSGPGNLALARAYRRSGRPLDAAAYYHRAIYGRWDDQVRRTIEVRFELVDLLSAEHRSADLLAELLPLDDLAGKDPATRIRLGTLFVEAGDLRRARADFTAAARAAPHDSVARRSLAVLERVQALEPSARGVSEPERDRRAVALVRASLAAVMACLGADSTSPPEVVARARQRLEPPRGGVEARASADDDIELAGELWRARSSSCARRTVDEEALELVIARSR